MTDQELLYTMELTLALHHQSSHQRTLIEAMGSATAVYENRHDISHSFEHLSPRLAETVATMERFKQQCENELDYAARHKIQILTRADDHYPARLRDCEDAMLTSTPSTSSVSLALDVAPNAGATLRPNL